jgi:cytochrome c553
MKYKFLIAVFSLVMGVNASAVAGDAAAGEGKAAACAACHMPDGNSVVPEFPKLAGQHEGYLVKQLSEFKSMKRKNDIMFGMAAALSEEDMADIGAYFAKQTAAPGAATDESKLALGKAIYEGGNAGTHVPACMGCHGPTGAGNAPANYPALAGQHVQYTLTQLKNFQSGARDNDPNKMMRLVAEHMSDAEMEAVANYIATLK